MKAVFTSAEAVRYASGGEVWIDAEVISGPLPAAAELRFVQPPTFSGVEFGGQEICGINVDLVLCAGPLIVSDTAYVGVGKKQTEDGARRSKEASCLDLTCRSVQEVKSSSRQGSFRLTVEDGVVVSLGYANLLGGSVIEAARVSFSFSKALEGMVVRASESFTSRETSFVNAHIEAPLVDIGLFRRIGDLIDSFVEAETVVLDKLESVSGTIRCRTLRTTRTKLAKVQIWADTIYAETKDHDPVLDCGHKGIPTLGGVRCASGCPAPTFGFDAFQA